MTKQTTSFFFSFQFLLALKFSDNLLLQIKLCKRELMVCSGFEPGVGGWKVQMNPLVY